MPDMDATTFLIIVAATVISLVIFYHIIKAAVKNGILDARAVQAKPYIPVTHHQQEPYSADQIALMKRYENNEISMEDYKSEWEKLKR